LEEDIKIRKFLAKELKEAGLDRIDIERTANNVTVVIYAAKPGLIIGRGGQGVEELKKKIINQFLEKKTNLNVNIIEVERPLLSAQIVLQQMINDIEKRIPFRRVMKQAIARVEKAGAQGVKVRVSGRLDGAEIARRETLVSGKMPLHTIRADIDYARGVARTTYGAIGLKIWIYRGEVFTKNES
jgi:small subunit ribosomal protein S3